jgi:hypothetical protein
MSKHQEQIIAAAVGKVSEPIIAAAWAKPRGATTAVAGGGIIVGAIGGKQVRNQRKSAEAAGIVLASPGAVAVTATSFLSMSVKVSLGGAIKEITEVLSSLPLADVDSVEVSRMGLTGVMKITADGNTFKLEGKVGDMKEFADAFDQAKASAA